MNDVFDGKCNCKLDMLQLVNGKKGRKVGYFIKKHKFFSFVLFLIFFLTVVDFYFVYSFINVLENIKAPF